MPAWFPHAFSRLICVIKEVLAYALEAPMLLECLQVLWLDITAAKARYGRWIDGCLPSFVPFPTSTSARTKQQKREAAVKAAARAASDLDDDSFIRLSHLRCSC